MTECKHPFDALYVAKNATEKKVDEDFINVCYYFSCGRCKKDLTITHAKIIGGVDAFIDRARGQA